MTEGKGRVPATTPAGTPKIMERSCHRRSGAGRGWVSTLSLPVLVSFKGASTKPRSEQKSILDKGKLLVEPSVAHDS